jgi:tetratricopeptide (TPR) repeat protein
MRPRHSGVLPIRRTGWGQVLFIFLCLGFALPSLAEKPRSYTANPIESASTYNQRARDAYAAGTWTVEELESSETKDPDHTRRSYEAALRAFTDATTAEPAMYEAHSYAGYVQRKLGRYENALRSYETALKLKPDYVYAIEYQGEAYLGLGDFTRARFNYLRLYALDQQLAAKLLNAMQAWLTQTANKSSPEFFAARDWIETRARQKR